MRQRLIGLGLAVGLMASCVGASSAPPASAPAAVGLRPNIVVILTDDMRWDELQNMPSVLRLLVAKGVQFTNAFVPNSLCCPSRSTILSGQFSNHTNVWNNNWSPSRPFGGFKAFIGHEDQTLATWLHASGYRTGMVGKYLNGFNAASAKGPGNPTGLAPRPGWDVWDSFVGANVGNEDPAYYDYDLDVQGTMVVHGDAPADYSTNVLGSAALDFVRTTPPTTPFFLYFAPYGPHSPYTPAPQDLNALPYCAADQSPPGCYQPIAVGAPGTCPAQTGLPPYCSENIAQKDVSGEVSWVKALPPIAGSAFDATRRRQEQTLLSVDRQVSALVGAVYARHQLHDTLFVFMSDNSLSGGSHRWINKMTAWDEADHIPMVVRFDPTTSAQAGSTDPAMVLNADVAPTALSVAGVTPPGNYRFDGQSIPPFNPGFARNAFPLEHLEARNANPPTYCGVRTTTWKYVRYHNFPHLGYPVYEEELYDLAADPFELHNLAADPADKGELATLKAQAEKLCDPPPPGFKWGG